MEPPPKKESEMTFAEMIAASRKNLKSRDGTKEQTSQPSSPPAKPKEEKELAKIEEEVNQEANLSGIDIKNDEDSFHTDNDASFLNDTIVTKENATDTTALSKMNTIPEDPEAEDRITMVKQEEETKQQA